MEIKVIIFVIAMMAHVTFSQGSAIDTRELSAPRKRQVCNLWTMQRDAYADGMTRQTDGLTEEQCKDACVAKPDCWTVDWVPKTRFFITFSSSQCYHGSVMGQGTSGYRVNGRHWIMQGNCRSNPCKPNPCFNNGVCSYNGNTFTCSCAAGYTGTNCALLADNCTPNRCLNGGVCFSGFNSFSCNCKPGYTGQQCEQLLNFCSPNPCLNGGQCSLNVQGYQYMCTCRAGFGGNNCRDLIDYCNPNPCLNGGQCQSGVQGYSYMCQCLYGFGGNNCRDVLNPRGRTYNCAQNNPCSVAGYNQGRIYFKHDNPNYLVQCTDVGGCHDLHVDPPEIADNIVDEANGM